MVTAVVNWIYFSRRKLPAKYLTPGVIFLVVFQIFVLIYTGYIAFTNYGTGHNGSKEQAVAALMSAALQRVPESPTYDVTCRRAATRRRAWPARHRPGRRGQHRHERHTADRGHWRRDGRRQSGRSRGLVDPLLPAGDRAHRRDHLARRAIQRRSERRRDPHARRIQRLPVPVHPRIRRGGRHDHGCRAPEPCTPISAPVHSPLRMATSSCPGGRSRSASTTSSGRSPTSDPRPTGLRHAVDLRLRAHLGRNDILPRTVPRDRLQRHADAWTQVLPRADDPALRVPVVPLGAGLGRHDERELRLHQPGAARRGIRALADGSSGSRRYPSWS